MDCCGIRFIFNGQSSCAFSFYLHKKADLSRYLADIPPSCLSSCIIGCDSNSSSPAWGAPSMDNRGTQIHAFLDAHGLSTLNVVPHPPTYVRRNCATYIDALFASKNFTDKHQEQLFRVLPRSELDSDHRTLSSSFSGVSPPPSPPSWPRLQEYLSR